MYVQYTYDKVGNRIKKTDTKGEISYFYNSKNQLLREEAGDTEKQLENLRFELLENGNRTRFVYHDGELLHEEGGKENRQTGYHLGAGIEAFSREQETYYCQQDEQLSTAFITGRNGAVHNSYRYDAFGNELETAGNGVFNK